MSAKLEGLLGRALAANVEGRLKHFVTDESSPAIALFDPARVAKNQEGDWYGEHAGKWLYAAAKAARRTGDADLLASVRRVADYLVSVQAADGYLGTYAPDRRFTQPQPAPQKTWDGAPSRRTWDIWTHSYVILGLLEAAKTGDRPQLSHSDNRGLSPVMGSKYLMAARKIGDLAWKTLTDGGIDITHLGNHHGMSATVMIDPAVELYFATGDAKYLDLAKLIVSEADARADLQLVSRARARVDAAEIGTGKAYQLIWNLVGLAKLHRATHDARYLEAATRAWESIRANHLTLGGGPWGGVAHRSREVFNAACVFSPYGFVETCSTFSWIQLNRELLAITADAKYAEEIERAAYNDLLGAQAPNGEDWCYYSYPNGKRVHTTYWRCCKSSGTMALEELPDVAYCVDADRVSVNLYGPGEARLATAHGQVTLMQETRYPFDGAIRIRVAPEAQWQATIRVRIPAWATHATVAVNGVKESAIPGTYTDLHRQWQPGDEIALDFPMAPVLHERSSRNVQESIAPDGAPVAQEVLRYDYAAITRGPLVYATGLIDGFKVEETLRLAGNPALEVSESPQGFEGPAIRMTLGYREPITFVPYYEAGGRADGAWRLTWMQRSPRDPTPPPEPPRGTK